MPLVATKLASSTRRMPSTKLSDIQQMLPVPTEFGQLHCPQPIGAAALRSHKRAAYRASTWPHRVVGAPLCQQRLNAPEAFDLSSVHSQ